MAKGTLRGERPEGCLRALLRLPLWLYRAGLGWVLGQRFVMFEHTGRKSGRVYKTVVEVIEHDRETDRYVVVSGWGEQADWYRNVMATPRVRLHTGRRTFDAVARRLSDEGAARALCGYAARHPLAFRVLSRIMTGERQEPAENACGELAGRVPVVAFERRETEEGDGDDKARRSA